MDTKPIKELIEEARSVCAADGGGLTYLLDIKATTAERALAEEVNPAPIEGDAAYFGGLLCTAPQHSEALRLADNLSSDVILWDRIGLQSKPEIRKAMVAKAHAYRAKRGLE